LVVAQGFYEWQVPAGGNDFTRFKYLSFRGAQGTQHPNTVAVAGALAFAVTVRDNAGALSHISIAAYGGGIGYRMGQDLRLGFNADKTRRLSDVARRQYDNLTSGMSVTYVY